LDADFPLQNLPLAVFAGEPGSGRIGVGIGDQLLDARGAVESGLLSQVEVEGREALVHPDLNAFMSLPRDVRRSIRLALSDLLSLDSPESDREQARRLLMPLVDVEFLLPARIGDYTDFYASIDHARRVGALFRPDNPLLPNYPWVPIGYHGRASSIIVDGTPVRRPSGQRHPEVDGEPPGFGPSTRLDYEVELGAWIGPGNGLGDAIEIDRAEEHFVGLSLLNDWSARDIQAWEYQPLGPFLGKSFASSLSPWVVTAEALAPHRCGSRPRGPGEPAPLPYLDTGAAARGLEITVEAWLRSEAMRKAGMEHFRLSTASSSGLYWTFAQMIAHHTSNGCNLRPGDLLGSGTISGPTDESRGCLLEITRGGRDPITLPSGESRRFLEDGDEVVLDGWCPGRARARRIGFGRCRGTILPSPGAG
jgi:fumarylacetoacetase